VFTPSGTCTISTDLQVGPTFTTFDLAGFINLSRITFGPQQTGGPGGPLTGCWFPGDRQYHGQ
jgi:hypothetical protein